MLRVTSVAGGGQTENWDGQVDLTPLAVLNARARNLKTLAESLVASSTLLPVVEEAPKPVRAKKAAEPAPEATVQAAPEPEAAPAPEAEAAPAKKAAPKKAAAETKSEDAPAKKPAAKKKPAADGGEA